MIERRFRHDPDQTTWIAGAKCIAEDPELFFPMGPPSLVSVQTARAKAVCEGCVVRDDCLEWSLVTAQDAENGFGNPLRRREERMRRI